MKLISYLLCFLLFISSNQVGYKIDKTNITKNAYPDSFYKNGIILSSIEPGENFYSLYYSKIINKREMGEPIKLKINKRKKFTHMSNGVYLKVANEFYFTSNNELGKLNLYKCKIEGYTLINPETVKTKNSENSNGHSTFSEDGLSMILSSGNMENTNLHLYTRKNLSSTWEFSRSLDELNTNNFEMHPKIVDDSLIYFSRFNKETNKMNIYYSRMGSDNFWTKPIKHEFFNSTSDDFSTIFLKDGSGYFCSNRSGNDRIYFFQRN